MTRRAELGLALVLSLALMVVYYWTHAKATVGPLMPVTDSPDVAAATLSLCQCAPLNSFGSGCQGLTWDYDDDTTLPTDWRHVLPSRCSF